MKNCKYLLAVTALLFNFLTNVSAQSDWDTIARFSYSISDLMVYEDDLFITGGFFECNDQTCYGSAYYDGTSLVPHTQSFSGTGLRDMTIFQGDLYAESGIFFSASIGIARWTGSTWEDGGGTSLGHSVVYGDGDYLYAVDQAGLIRRIDANGSSETIYDFEGDGDVYAIIRYGSNLIFAGEFDEIDGVTASNIASWDGTNWSALGDGVDDLVRTLEVMGNKLYVGGDFEQAGGDDAATIAVWNGTSWSDVGGSESSGNWWASVYDLKAYEGKLFVAGLFFELGGIEVRDLAMWNGTAWNTFDFDHPNYAISALEVYNGYLYVGSNDFDSTYVWRYKAPYGSPNEIDEVSSTNDFSLSPNPSKSHFNLFLPDQYSERSTLEVHSIDGHLVYTTELTSHTAQISITDWPSGVYTFIVKNDDYIMTKKAIKH